MEMEMEKNKETKTFEELKIKERCEARLKLWETLKEKRKKEKEEVRKEKKINGGENNGGCVLG